MGGLWLLDPGLSSPVDFAANIFPEVVRYACILLLPSESPLLQFSQKSRGLCRFELLLSNPLVLAEQIQRLPFVALKAGDMGSRTVSTAEKDRLINQLPKV